MLSLNHEPVLLCDGLTRREWLRAGGLGAFGLALPELLRARSVPATTERTETAFGKAKACIVLFLLGGPPQHETWDPKPDAPAGIRGDLRPISSAVPGMQVGELMPQVARQADKCCVLRAMSTNDNAHSSSGYWMLTGYPHQPMNSENSKLGAPNDWPSFGAVIKHRRQGNGLPPVVTLPEHIWNTGNIPWPGQDAGWLGRQADPWLLTCDPSAADFRVPQMHLPQEVPPLRLEGRRSLLSQVNHHLDRVTASDTFARYHTCSQQAFDLLRSPKAQARVRPRSGAASRPRPLRPLPVWTERAPCSPSGGSRSRARPGELDAGAQRLGLEPGLGHSHQ